MTGGGGRGAEHRVGTREPVRGVVGRVWSDPNCILSREVDVDVPSGREEETPDNHAAARASGWGGGNKAGLLEIPAKDDCVVEVLVDSPIRVRANRNCSCTWGRSPSQWSGRRH